MNYADSRPVFDIVTERKGQQKNVFGAGGVRFLLGRHAFALVEGIVYVAKFEDEFSDLARDPGTPSVFGDIPWRWRVGAGVRF